MLKIILPTFLPGILFLGHLRDNLISRYAVRRTSVLTGSVKLLGPYFNLAVSRTFGRRVLDKLSADAN